jgi:hypothetical protein
MKKRKGFLGNGYKQLQILTIKCIFQSFQGGKRMFSFQ